MSGRLWIEDANWPKAWYPLALTSHYCDRIQPGELQLTVIAGQDDLSVLEVISVTPKIPLALMQLRKKSTRSKDEPGDGEA